MEEQTYIIDRLTKKSGFYNDRDKIKGAKVKLGEVLRRKGPWFHADLTFLEDTGSFLYEEGDTYYFAGVTLKKV